MRILLVEDQDDQARNVKRRLTGSGFVVDRVGTVRDALFAVSSARYDLAVLDRRLPDGDGLQVIPKLRQAQPDSRVLILSALDDIDQRIGGLDAGGDDYLVKPFDLDELMARVRATLRRGGVSAMPPVAIGALAFDPATRSVSIHGRAAAFHRRELALLEALLRRGGRVVEREALLSEIWGFDDEVQPNALTNLVSRLRARLTEYDAGVDIVMVRGVGYFASETSAANR
jgi:two-component system, OmpR family, response regulator